jgi:pyrroloquinoline-quinone synthase
MNIYLQTPPLAPEELEAALRHIGGTRYHNLHPFHRLLHGGKLNRGQVQALALNRYYYQSRIPAKDASLLARLPTAELRRVWRNRLEDHDGTSPGTGGVARWLKLAEGVGLDAAYVESTDGLLAGTRFAVDAYVAFVRERVAVPIHRFLSLRGENSVARDSNDPVLRGYRKNPTL